MVQLLIEEKGFRRYFNEELQATGDWSRDDIVRLHYQHNVRRLIHMRCVNMSPTCILIVRLLACRNEVSTDHMT